MKGRFLISLFSTLLSFLVIVTFFNYEMTAAAASDFEVLKVGAPNAYTGSGASSGIPTLRAYKIQAQILKENGGFTVGGKKYRLELIQADDGYTAAGGKAAAEKLIFADKVKFLLGPLSSAATMGMLPLLEENKVISITNSITVQKFKSGCRYIFQANPQGGRVLATQVMRIIENNNVKRVAAFSPNDETGRQNWEQMQTGIKKIWDKYGKERVKLFMTKLPRERKAIIHLFWLNCLLQTPNL